MAKSKKPASGEEGVITALDMGQALNRGATVSVSPEGAVEITDKDGSVRRGRHYADKTEHEARDSVTPPEDREVAQDAPGIVGLTEENRQKWREALKPEDGELRLWERRLQNVGETNIDINRKAEELAEKMAAQQVECARLLGQIQAFDLTRKTGDVSTLLILRQIKESKIYKHYKIDANGTTGTVTTWEQYCEAALGKSREQVDEDLRNLSVLGEALLQSSQAMGLGYRQLRALRALPEGEREKLKAAGDPEELKCLLEDALVEKARLEKHIKDQTANMKAREDVFEQKSKALDATRTALAKLKSLDVDGQAKLDAEKSGEALSRVIDACNMFTGAGIAFFTTVNAALRMERLEPHIREQIEATATMQAQAMADFFATQLDWYIDFKNLVYPDWVKKLDEKANGGQGSPEADCIINSAE